jgi:hypothetical protein
MGSAAPTDGQGEDSRKADTASMPAKGWKGRLPTWAARPLTSPNDWKTLFRCWAILFGSFVLLLVHTSLRTLGNAALFVVILNVRRTVPGMHITV